MTAGRVIPGLVLCCALAACASGDGTGAPQPPPAPPATVSQPVVSSRAADPPPAPAAGSPGGTVNTAFCAPLVSAWQHQLEVTKDAQDWADKVDDPAVKQAAGETARRDQQIADDMLATLTRSGCPVPR